MATRNKKKLSSRDKQSRKLNRDRATKKWLRTTARRAGFALALVSTLYIGVGGFWYWHTGKLAQTTDNIASRYYAMTARMGFTVQEIFLDGRKTTEMKEVVNALGLRMGDPIFAQAPEALQARLQALPTVRYAAVDRELPGTLHIRIVERTPVAVWQHAGNRALLDADGIVMEKARLADYPGLPVIVGEDAPDHMRDLYAFLVSEPELFAQVAAAVRVSERRWNIRFKNGLQVKLPSEGAAAAWVALARMENEQHLLQRDISSVDLRLKDRVFIKLSPAAQAAGKNPPKET